MPLPPPFDLINELGIPVLLALVGGTVSWILARFGLQRGSTWAMVHPGRADRLSNSIVLALIALYIVLLGGLSVARHNALHSYSYDLGIFSQVLWNTSKGHLFQNTVMIEYAENLLGQHFSPVFLLIVPLYWVWPDPRGLLLLQTVALALGALPLFWLARRKTGSRIAAILIAAAYLVAPALHFVNLYDFHEIALVPPLLFLALWFLETGRTGPLLAVLGAALLCREEVGLIMAAFGGVLLWRRHWIAGLVAVAVGSAWTWTAIALIVPYFQESTTYYYVVRYGQLGTSIADIITTVVTRPDFVFTYLTTGPRGYDRAVYLARLIVPVAGLAVLSPGVMVLAAPTLAYLLLSDYRELYAINSQYSAPIIPFLFAATAVTIGALSRRTPLAIGLAGGVLVASLAATVQYGPTPIGRTHDPRQFEVTDHARLAYTLMARIPSDVSVSTQSPFIPHLANRRELYQFPYVHGAEYVLLDNWFTRWPLNTAQWHHARDELLANPAYELIHSEDGYLLFKRAPSLPVQQPVSVNFLDTYELVGVDTPNRILQPGETFEVALYWKPLTSIGSRRTKDRFTSTVILKNEDGDVLTRVDKEFWDGLLTTDRLIKGEIHRERYILTAPDTAGTYDIVSGLAAFASRRPLAIHVNGKRTDQFTKPVATVRVDE